MDSMSDMERRCLDKALAVPLAHNGENDFWSDTAGIVRAVLAEAGVAELVEAAAALRDDMLMRAKCEAWQHDGEIIVEAGAGVWSRFNAALAKSRA